MNHLHWCTQVQQVQDRPAFWGEVNRRYFGRLRVSCLDDGPLDASVDAYQVGALPMFRIEAPAHRVTRDESCGELPTDDFYKLVLQVRGRGLVEQNGRRVALAPGGWSLYDPRADYAITAHERCTLLVTQVPRHLLGPLGPAPLVGQWGSHGAAGLHGVFGTFLCALSDQLAALPDAVGPAVSESIMGLLGSTLAEQLQRRGDPVPLPAVLKLRVRHYVQANLADPGLSVPRIAEALRCSTRYLYRVFEPESASLEQMIWTTRLERCHAALKDEVNAGRSVAQIAMGWGFKSSAHFSRLFKRQYGMTPGAAQQQAAAERTTAGAALAHFGRLP